MGSTTKHGLPYPVGTDLIMEGDNAIEALARKVDASLWPPTAPSTRPAPGVWAVATGCFLANSTTGTAHPGSSVTEARYMMIGNTVFLIGSGSVGTTACADLAVRLPNALTGTPRHRQYNVGSYVIMGTGAPTQMYHGVMTSPFVAVVAVTSTGAYADAAAGMTCRWNFTYEVAPPPADVVDTLPELPEGGTLPGPTDENDEEA